MPITVGEIDRISSACDGGCSVCYGRPPDRIFKLTFESQNGFATIVRLCTPCLAKLTYEVNETFGIHGEEDR